MIEPPDGSKLLETARAILDRDDEMNPILFFDYEQDEVKKGIIMPCEEMHPLQMLALLTVSINAGALPRPHWIALVTDSYVLTADKSEAIDRLEPGELEIRFKAKDPSVGEGLMVHCVSTIGTVFCLQQKYIRDGSTVIWDEIEDHSMEMDKLGGAVVEGMKGVIGFDDGEDDDERPVQFHS